MSQLTGCGNHMCNIKKPTGMGTNGPCQCPQWKYERRVYELNKRVAELEVLLTDLIAESTAEKFILTQGYKPAIEKAAVYLGLTENYGSDALRVDTTRTLEQSK